MKTLSVWSPRPDAKVYESISPFVCVYGLPVMEIIPTCIDYSKIASSEVLIFISHHAVSCFTAKVPRSFFCNKKLIAIGGKTEKAIKSNALEVTLTAPPPFTSEALLGCANFQKLPFKKMAIICGMGGRSLLQQELNKRGKTVVRIACYRRDRANLSVEDMIQFITSNAIGGVILSSCEVAALVADHLIELNKPQFFELPAFVFSERIAHYAKQLGFSNVVVAQQANQHFLYQRINNWWKGELR